MNFSVNLEGWRALVVSVLVVAIVAGLVALLWHADLGAVRAWLAKPLTDLTILDVFWMGFLLIPLARR